MNESQLRELVPAVIGVLVRRGADFTAAEDAVQDAMVDAIRTWPSDPPRDPKGWLVTVAWRRFVDAVRADTSRRHREDLVEAQPRSGPAEATDDTLRLYFLCAHPVLTPASAVALTLRAVAGLTTRQIAEAYLVPEATMAQRISRAKRKIAEIGIDPPGDVATVLRVLYLVFNEGYGGDVDLAGEAIRLTRQLAAGIDHEEVAGLLALMLLHHARRAARTRPSGALVPLAEQDRSLWDTRLIAEGVRILQAALARDRLGEFQAQAAIAALHADARTAEETDWVQIVEWYDELVRLTNSPVARLNRAVAVGEADGARSGLAALSQLDPSLPRYDAVAAYLSERDGDLAAAARSYSQAAGSASSLPERDHLLKQAARLNAGLNAHNVERSLGVSIATVRQWKPCPTTFSTRSPRVRGSLTPTSSSCTNRLARRPEPCGASGVVSTSTAMRVW
ncbi:RNA polymerase ECF family sigma subunit [Stackebrandtia endophytica]|uniref:RNA polymerase ECF family sigma subunit n=1 Tax=Stackebrandtia endophytica TaxID=1496996 RepID=A0A543APV5_9ACTN|nr:sigma-70 family RNA polymerase sigma factor [Stackebrandtia endophytica]TQL74579.1 RNA polymerase ECF family sigma subunit [Stackebrandtia endophytica]